MSQPLVLVACTVAARYKIPYDHVIEGKNKKSLAKLCSILNSPDIMPLHCDGL